MVHIYYDQSLLSWLVLMIVHQKQIDDIELTESKSLYVSHNKEGILSDDAETIAYYIEETFREHTLLSNEVQKRYAEKNLIAKFRNKKSLQVINQIFKPAFQTSLMFSINSDQANMVDLLHSYYCRYHGIGNPSEDAIRSTSSYLKTNRLVNFDRIENT